MTSSDFENQGAEEEQEREEETKQVLPDVLAEPEDEQKPASPEICVFTSTRDSDIGKGTAKKLKRIVMYSLCSELLVAEMDVSRTKIRLDTSISMTSNSERREYDRSLPIQSPSMLSTNNFHNLIHNRGVENTSRAQIPSLWDIQRDTGSNAERKDGWGNNNYQILEEVRTNRRLLQYLLNQVNELRDMVVNHIKFCDNKPPPPSEDQA
jgi:hypothetical protein